MSDPTLSEDSTSRTKIVRDVLIFQAKLWLEGFKDFVLMPLSLGAAVIDLVFQRSGQQGTLYSVMRMGDRFEQWVHLYAALEAESDDGGGESDLRSLDQLLNEAADGIEETSVSSRSDPSDASRSNS
jgi:hypothetical protein